ncbi:response regulator [Parachryseolinea silvisoli]|jgi:CheY-like chemotaxis protein|uniref:response regulator n=1 Tax=Parachryseolinea silvisoli TaxID=2873601 RepID=UPI0022658E92|nr:response regulator [Parachryseolinea silvisoli]MCD9015139.1 response regulator [Parachryseolinea silvisoli]
MKTILVIEDNPEIRENTAEILELSGFKVVTASSGQEGLAMTYDPMPDIILCDIMMSQIDGYEVIRQLKRNPLTASIPFVYLTAKVEKDELKLAMDLGACAYIRKPFDADDLVRTVNHCLL